MNNGSFGGVVLEASLTGLVVNAAEFQWKFLEGKIDLTKFHRNFATFFATNFTARLRHKLAARLHRTTSPQNFAQQASLRKRYKVSSVWEKSGRKYVCNNSRYKLAPTTQIHA